MSTNCPKCNAEQVLSDKASKGFEPAMQCIRCGHVWEHHNTATGKPGQGVRRIVLRPHKDKSALMEKAQKLVAGVSDKTKKHIPPHEDMKTEGDGPMDTAVPSKKSPQPDSFPANEKRRKSALNWQNIAAGVVAFMIFAGGLTMWRNIVSVNPATQALYKLVGIDPNPRGLEFASVKTRARSGNDGAVLVVEGLIKNITANAVALPAVHVAMRTSDGQVISSWLYQPKRQRLEAGEAFEFSTEVKNPPQNTRDIKLNFADRRPHDGEQN